MAAIYTVSQLNNEIKDLLDAVPGYRSLLVQGEISNYQAHSSGHHYMTALMAASRSLSVM